MWRTFLAWLAALSADPDAITKQQPVADAACFAAYACQKEKEPDPTPQPKPPEPPDENECCGECGNTGKIVMPDGHVVACPCPDDCACKKNKQPECPDGNCPVPAAQNLSPAPVYIRRRFLR